MAASQQGLNADGLQQEERGQQRQYLTLHNAQEQAEQSVISNNEDESLSDPEGGSELVSTKFNNELDHPSLETEEEDFESWTMVEKTRSSNSSQKSKSAGGIFSFITKTNSKSGATKSGKKSKSTVEHGSFPTSYAADLIAQGNGQEHLTNFTFLAPSLTLPKIVLDDGPPPPTLPSPPSPPETAAVDHDSDTNEEQETTSAAAATLVHPLQTSISPEVDSGYKSVKHSKKSKHRRKKEPQRTARPSHNEPPPPKPQQATNPNSKTFYAASPPVGDADFFVCFFKPGQKQGKLEQMQPMAQHANSDFWLWYSAPLVFSSSRHRIQYAYAVRPRCTVSGSSVSVGDRLYQWVNQNRGSFALTAANYNEDLLVYFEQQSMVQSEPRELVLSETSMVVVDLNVRFWRGILGDVWQNQLTTPINLEAAAPLLFSLIVTQTPEITPSTWLDRFNNLMAILMSLYQSCRLSYQLVHGSFTRIAAKDCHHVLQRLLVRVIMAYLLLPQSPYQEVSELARNPLYERHPLLWLPKEWWQPKVLVQELKVIYNVGVLPSPINEAIDLILRFALFRRIYAPNVPCDLALIHDVVVSFGSLPDVAEGPEHPLSMLLAELSLQKPPSGSAREHERLQVLLTDLEAILSPGLSTSLLLVTAPTALTICQFIPFIDDKMVVHVAIPRLEMILSVSQLEQAKDWPRCLRLVPPKYHLANIFVRYLEKLLREVTPTTPLGFLVHVTTDLQSYLTDTDLILLPRVLARSTFANVRSAFPASVVLKIKRSDEVYELFQHWRDHQMEDLRSSKRDEPFTVVTTVLSQWLTPGIGKNGELKADEAWRLQWIKNERSAIVASMLNRGSEVVLRDIRSLDQPSFASNSLFADLLFEYAQDVVSQAVQQKLLPLRLLELLCGTSANVEDVIVGGPTLLKVVHTYLRNLHDPSAFPKTPKDAFNTPLWRNLLGTTLEIAQHDKEALEICSTLAMKYFIDVLRGVSKDLQTGDMTVETFRSMTKMPYFASSLRLLSYFDAFKTAENVQETAGEIVQPTVFEMLTKYSEASKLIYVLDSSPEASEQPNPPPNKAISRRSTVLNKPAKDLSGDILGIIEQWHAIITQREAELQSLLTLFLLGKRYAAEGSAAATSFGQLYDSVAELLNQLAHMKLERARQPVVLSAAQAACMPAADAVAIWASSALFSVSIERRLRQPDIQQQQVASGEEWIQLILMPLIDSIRTQLRSISSVTAIEAMSFESATSLLRELKNNQAREREWQIMCTNNVISQAAAVTSKNHVLQMWQEILLVPLWVDRARAIVDSCQAFVTSDTAEPVLGSSAIFRACATLLRVFEEPEVIVRTLLQAQRATITQAEGLVGNDELVYERLQNLAKARDLIEFLREHGQKELNDMLPAIDTYSDKFVKASNIQELLILQRQLKPLLEKTTRWNSPDAVLPVLIERVRSNQAAPEHVIQAVIIASCTTSLPSIRRLFRHLFDRSQNTRDSVTSVMTQGRFKVERPAGKNSVFSFSASCIDMGQAVTLSAETLNDLRGRALLIKPTASETNEISHQARIMGAFVLMVDACAQTVAALNQLNAIGAPLLHVKLPIVSSNVEEMQRLAQETEKKREIWETSWQQVIAKFVSMRHFHPCQLTGISALLSLPPAERVAAFKSNANKIDIRDSGDVAAGAISFSSIAHTADAKQILQSNLGTIPPLEKPSGEENYLDILTKIAQAVSRCLRNVIVGAITPMVWSAAEAREHNFAPMAPLTAGRIHLALIGSSKLVPNCLLALHLAHGIIPHPERILICDRHTDWMSLMTFIYRAVQPRTDAPATVPSADFVPLEITKLSATRKKDTKSIAKQKIGSEAIPSFFLVFPEVLEIDVQNRLLSLTNELFVALSQSEREKCPRLCFVSVRVNTSEHIQREFDETNRFTVDPLPMPVVQTLLRKIQNDVQVITSMRAGFGKSLRAEELARERGVEISTVSLSSHISMPTLLNGIRSVKSISNSHALHLSLTNISEEQAPIVELLLFELVLLRCLNDSETRLPLLVQNPFILIEIGATATDLANTFGFTTSFHHQHLTIDTSFIQLASRDSGVSIPYHIPADPCHDVRIVCAYLYLLQQHQVGQVELSFPPSNGNLLPAQTLSDAQCRALLKNYFYDVTRTPHSYNVLHVFVKVLAEQLRRFSESLYFKMETLSLMCTTVVEAHHIRTLIVENLVTLSRDFAVKSLGARDEQLKDLLKIGDAALASQVRRTANMLKWHESSPSMLVFNSDDINTLTPIFRRGGDMPAGMRTLFENQKQLEEHLAFEKATPEQMLERLQRIVCSKRLQISAMADTKVTVKSKTSKTSAQAKQLIQDNYVLTLDNFVKMCLIMLRVDARIPVVLMGESGCGKTSLLRFLAHVANAELHILSVHAGTTVADFEAIVSKVEAACSRPTAQQQWLFFDEINTSDAVGTASDLVCHRLKPNGQRLHDRVILLAACNPYRLRAKTSEPMTGGLLLKGSDADPLSKLVYRVHPVPESLLDYAWDFGVLNPAEEVIYIQRMAYKTLSNAGFDHVRVAQLLVDAQDFVRSNQEAWSVSLRDVERCLDLMLWFSQDHLAGDYRDWQASMFGMLKRAPPGITTLSKKERLARSVALSLAVCYRSRLHSETLRDRLQKKLHSSWGDLPGSVVEYVNQEERAYIEMMTLDPSTAKNAALREMVFVTLVCIVNHIPLIIVDHPGTGKSLTMSILRASCLGRDSSHPFLKKLPALVIVQYQGSQSSTSEGILHIFEQAQEVQRADSLAVVLLDEIGLAEISPHNPLKVLHKLLEPGTGERPDVAVVGISNWALDPAKMNRAVHLSRPKLSTADLDDTAQTIFKATLQQDSTTPLLPADSNNLKMLAARYHDYVNKVSSDRFHGLRDFYGHVKAYATARRSSLDAARLDPSNQGAQEYAHALQRNFSGRRREIKEKPGEFPVYMQAFVAHLPPASVHTFPTLELISANLFDRTARHLLLIVSGAGGEALATHALRLAYDSGANQQGTENLPPRVFYGSSFPDDDNDESRFRILSEVIICMETGRTVVFTGKHNIYSSLYDMLNQKYVYLGTNRQHCRIALGASSNPMCLVHENFRCVVIMLEEDADKADPPFLNRFEKLRLSYEDFFSQPQNEACEALTRWIYDISTSADDQLPFMDGPGSLLVGFSRDTVASVVLDNSSPQVDLDVCRAELLSLATVDGVLRASRSRLAIQDQLLMSQSQTIYFEQQAHDNLHDCLTQELKLRPQGARLVLYTFSSILHDISGSLKTVLPEAKHRVLLLSSVHSENELTKQLNAFVMDSSSSILAIQVDVLNEQARFCHALFVADEVLLRANSPKHVVFILHVLRNVAERFSMALVRGWKFVTIDHLLSSNTGLRPSACRRRRLADLVFADDAPAPLTLLLQDAVETAILRLPYPKTIAWRNRPMELRTAIKGNSALIADIASILRGILQTDAPAPSVVADQWLVDLACDQSQLLLHQSLGACIRYWLINSITNPVAELLALLESWGGLDHLLLNGQIAATARLESFWRACLRERSVLSLTKSPVMTGMPAMIAMRQRANMALTFVVDLPPQGRIPSIAFPFGHFWLTKLDRILRERYLRSRTEVDTAGADVLPVLASSEDSSIDPVERARERERQRVDREFEQLLVKTLGDLHANLRADATQADVLDTQHRLYSAIVEMKMDACVRAVDGSPPAFSSPNYQQLQRIVECSLKLRADISSDTPLATCLLRLWLNDVAINACIDALQHFFGQALFPADLSDASNESAQVNALIKISTAAFSTSLSSVAKAVPPKQPSSSHALLPTPLKVVVKQGMSSTSSAFVDLVVEHVAVRLWDNLAADVPRTSAKVAAIRAALLQDILYFAQLIPPESVMSEHAAAYVDLLKFTANVLEWWGVVASTSASPKLLSNFCQAATLNVNNTVVLWSNVRKMVESVEETNVEVKQRNSMFVATFVQLVTTQSGGDATIFLEYMSRASASIALATSAMFHPFVWPIQQFIMRYVKLTDLILIATSSSESARVISQSSALSALAAAISTATPSTDLLDDNHFAVAVTDALIMLCARSPTTAFYTNHQHLAGAFGVLSSFASPGPKTAHHALSACAAAALSYHLLSLLSQELDERGQLSNSSLSQPILRSINGLFLPMQTNSEPTLEALLVLLIKHLRRRLPQTVDVKAETIRRAEGGLSILSQMQWTLPLIGDTAALAAFIGTSAIRLLGFNPLFVIPEQNQVFAVLIFMTWNKEGERHVAALIDKALEDPALMKALLAFVASIVELGVTQTDEQRQRRARFLSRIVVRINERKHPVAPSSSASIFGSFSSPSPPSSFGGPALNMLHELSRNQLITFKWADRLPQADAMALQSLLLHYAIQLVHHTTITSILGMLLIDPAQAKSRFIPSLPVNDEAQRLIGIIQAGGAEGSWQVTRYECSNCHTPFYVHNCGRRGHVGNGTVPIEDRCVGCKRVVAGDAGKKIDSAPLNFTNVDSAVGADVPGWVNDEPADLVGNFTRVRRRLTPVAFRAIHQAVFATLLAGYLFVHRSEKSMRDFFGSQVSIDYCVRICWEHVVGDYKALGAGEPAKNSSPAVAGLLGITRTADLTALLHSFVAPICEASAKGPACTTAEQRRAIEATMAEAISAKTAVFASSIQTFTRAALDGATNMNNTSTLTASQNVMPDVQIIDEVNEIGRHMNWQPYRQTRMPRLLRCRPEMPTAVNDIIAQARQYLARDAAASNAHPFLALVLNSWQDIVQITALRPLIRFSDSVRNLLRNQLTRAEQTLSLGDFLEREASPLLNEEFELFCATWNGFVGKEVQLDCHTLVLPKIDRQSPVSMAFVDPTDESFLCALMATLAKRQFNFVKSANELAASGIPSLAHLLGSQRQRRDEEEGVQIEAILAAKTVPIRCVRLSDVISIDQEQIQTSFNQSFAHLELPNTMVYMLGNIEAQLAHSFLGHYPMIRAGVDDFSPFPWRGEVMRAGTIVADVKAAVAQSRLTEEASQRFAAYLSTHNSLERDLLDALALALLQASRYRPPPSQTLGVFARMALPARDVAAIEAVANLRAMPLRHLVHAFEITEETLGSRIINVLPPNFRKPLPNIAATSITQLLQHTTNAEQKHVPALITALKRLSFRRLLNEDGRMDVPLSQYLQDPQLWSDEEFLDWSDQLPQEAQLAHTHALYKLLLEFLQAKTALPVVMTGIRNKKPGGK